MIAVAEGTWEDFPYYSKGTKDRACEEIVCCMQRFYPFSIKKEFLADSWLSSQRLHFPHSLAAGCGHVAKF